MDAGHATPDPAASTERNCAVRNKFSRNPALDAGSSRDLRARMAGQARHDDKHEPHEAWVCFSGEAELWWLKMLKPGFRHCFVVARDAKSWIVLDPLSPHLELAVLPMPRGFDLPRWLEGQGLTVVKAPIRRGHNKAAPANWFSCVEVIKRFLGIHARQILTPWQLYSYLKKEMVYG